MAMESRGWSIRYSQQATASLTMSSYDVGMHCFGCFHEGVSLGFSRGYSNPKFVKISSTKLNGETQFCSKGPGGTGQARGRPAAVPCRRAFRATGPFGFPTRFGKGISGKP